MTYRVIVAALVCATVSASVARIEVTERTPYLDGRTFGSVGPYEMVRAKVFFEADPRLRQNSIVVDIGLAPRNARGFVEWSTDLVVLKPRDLSKGNGTLLFEVPNRGGRGMLTTFNRPNEHLLMEQGFTLVWCGWQWDLPPATRDLVRLSVPIATDNGKPIRGLVRAEWVPAARATKMPLGDRNHEPYRVVADARLTVRDSANGARSPIAASAWKVVDEGGAIEMPDGFEPGRIYEVVYTSENPRVAGLGSAAVRDVVSFFKFGGAATELAEQRNFIKRSLGFGSSQSGRFLRKFLYDGFNEDEAGRQVFDGVWAHISGAGRGGFNHRFAQASRDGHPRLNFFYPVDIAPFTDDGILARARKSKVVPKIFWTDGSYEYWGRAAALAHVTPDGTADAPLAAEARRYYLTGTQHGSGQFPPSKTNNAVNLTNSNDVRFAMRALLLAMNAWLTSGQEPPKSIYPSIARGELVAFDKLKFPLSSVAIPAHPRRAWRVDYGPKFESSGIVANEPPRVGIPFPALVPNVDGTGNELGGLRLPQVAVPLAVYTGWNYRTSNIGAASEMSEGTGSTFPLSQAQVMQLYKDKQDYLDKSQAVARRLVTERYLLDGDVSEILARAGQQWEYWSRTW